LIRFFAIEKMNAQPARRRMGRVANYDLNHNLRGMLEQYMCHNLLAEDQILLCIIRYELFQEVVCMSVLSLLGNKPDKFNFGFLKQCDNER